MHLTPKEFDKLIIHSVAQVANARRSRGIKLNHPEATAVIAAAALEGAREGKTVEEVMHDAAPCPYQGRGDGGGGTPAHHDSGRGGLH